MKRLLLSCGFFALFSLAACTPQTADTSAVGARAEAIQAHLEFLADDLLEGRDTGTRGHEIASSYIATQFKLMGIEPAGTDGYFQRITFRTARIVANSPKFIVHANGESQELAYPRAFMTGPSALAEEQSVTAPVVFVGYGMVSDQFGFDDYAGLDVEGAIVMMLSGLPEGLPSEEAAHLGRIKTELALERGAVGIITLHTPKAEETRPWERSMLFLNATRMRWLGEDGLPHGEDPQIQGAASLNYQEAAPLFAHSDILLDDVWAAMEAGEMPRGGALNVSVTMERKSTHDEVTSPNVIGMIEGSDPELKDEFVLFTAHSDHIGRVRSVEGEPQFNNGALDNAAGVAIMIETARMFADAVARGDQPKRSIMFAALTAEEKGLLGADYFANNPTVPIENIVANVNLDMPVLLYPFADIIAFGANHSTMKDVVAEAAGEFGIKLSPDPMPEQAIFTRSDHYALVQKGIPAVFLMTGFESQDPEQDGGAIWSQFFAEQYHRPGDEISTLTEVYGEIRYDFGAIFTDINYAIGRNVANNPERPEWLPESYFGQVFAGGEGSIRH
ncbi:MAG: M28 family peptidase [Idiomarina sp.]|nr:M28 family peptidase [Idiomarina sp.]